MTWRGYWDVTNICTWSLRNYC